MPVIPTVPEDIGAIQGPNVHVDKEAFGVGIGRSLTELGNTLSHAGDKIYARAQSIQQQQNDDIKQQIETDFLNESAPVKAQYEALQGQDKVDALSKYQADLTALKDKALGRAPNPYVRNHMNNFLLRNIAYSISHAAGQAASAQRQATIDTAKARRSANDAWLHSFAGTEDYLHVYETWSAKNRELAYIEAGTRGIRDPEVINEMIAREEEKGRAIVVTALNETNPVAAKKLLTDWAGKFGASTEKLTHAVNQQNRDTVTRIVNGEVTRDLYTDEGEGKSLEERVREARDKVKALLPNDEQALTQVTREVTAAYTRHRSSIRDQENTDYQDISGVVGGWTSPNAMRPINVDQMQAMFNPDQKAAWSRLSNTRKNQIRNALANNARDPVMDTPERHERFEQLWGMAGDNPVQFMEQDLFGEDITKQQKQDLFNRRKAIIKQQGRDPRVGHAINVLQPELYAAGALRSQDESKYYRFVGALERLMLQQEGEGKKPMKMEEIKLMGSRLLQSQITSPAWFGVTTRQTPMISASIPSALEKEITESWISNHGRPPTPQELGSAFMILKYNKLYKKSSEKEDKATENPPNVPASK